MARNIFSNCPAVRLVLTVCFIDEQPFYLINKPGGCILYLQPAPAGVWKSFTTRFGRCCCNGLFLVDGQALACNDFGILGEQSRGHGLDSFAVQAGAGEVRQLDFMASYLQVAGIALGHFSFDLGLDSLLLGLGGLNQLGGLFVLDDEV